MSTRKKGLFGSFSFTGKNKEQKSVYENALEKELSDSSLHNQSMRSSFAKETPSTRNSFNQAASNSDEIAEQP